MPRRDCKVNCQCGRLPLPMRKGWEPFWEENLGSPSFKSEEDLEPRFERYKGIWRCKETFGGFPRAPGMLVRWVTAQPGPYNKTLNEGWNVCVLYTARGQINLRGTSCHTALLIGFPMDSALCVVLSFQRFLMVATRPHGPHLGARCPSPLS